jgi:UDP-N-acetylglucosamine 4-epimerase
LNELWAAIKESTKTSVDPIYGPERNGDVPHSLADISKGRILLDYQPKFSVADGLKRAYDWYKANL